MALVFAGMSAAACGVVVKDPFANWGNDKLVPADTISRADALQDLDALMVLLEHVHPDPYRIRPRQAVHAERLHVTETMPATLTKRELCLRLSRVIAVIDDGHTSMNCIDLIRLEWRRATDASPPETQRLLRFPPFIRLDDQQHLIVSWHGDSPTVDPGDRLLRVNGEDTDALIAAWMPEISHDTDAGRRAEIARMFRAYLALHGISAPYRLTVAAPGEPPREVTVEGEPVNYSFQDRPKVPPRPLPPPARPRPFAVFGPIKLENAFFTYRILEPDVGYVNFFSPLDGLSTVSRFRKAVDALFTQVASDGPRVLVLDIRENGGGEDTVAAELLRHMTRKPFRLFASTQIKRSQEARDFANSIVRIPFRWLGLPYLSSEARRYFNGKPGTMAKPIERRIVAHPPAEPFYSGPVCVLTGPHTYSAAVEFAEAVKTFGLATVVGEETGGQPNSFGNQIPFRLPHSGLTVTIATNRGVRASGSLTDFESVAPDIVVRTTADDMRGFFDPVLDRARTCPERSIE